MINIRISTLYSYWKSCPHHENWCLSDSITKTFTPEAIAAIYLQKMMKLTLFSWNLFDASVWRSGTYIAIDTIYNQGTSLIKLFMKKFFKTEAHFKGRSKKIFKQTIFFKVFFPKRILYKNMSWELILKIHVHQNKVILAKGFHKVGTLRFRNFRTLSPSLCAKTLFTLHTNTHTHTHLSARVRILFFKEDMTEIHFVN